MKLLKKIFSKWNENKELIYLNYFLIPTWVLLTFVINKPFWNLYPFLITLFICSLSTLLDRRTYANLPSWLGIFPFCYIIWWFLFLSV